VTKADNSTTTFEATFGFTSLSTKRFFFYSKDLFPKTKAESSIVRVREKGRREMHWVKFMVAESSIHV
jgi:hypothetical protein